MKNPQQIGMLLLLLAAVCPMAAQPIESPPPVIRHDENWGQLQAAIADASGPRTAEAGSLRVADLAREFHSRFPDDPKAAEAQKVEALFLIDAAVGDPSLSTRASAVVRNVRRNPKIPAFDRAVVAGTYEFAAARNRINSPDELVREHEAVARALVREFPDQPQGYVSLLTQAWRLAPDASRSVAAEVATASAAPANVKEAARRLLVRLDLVGQRIRDVVAPSILLTGEPGGWQAGQPGLVYFWSISNPHSITLGEELCRRLRAGANVLSICLDTPNDPLELGTVDPREDRVDAAADKMPGRPIILTGGASNPVAVRLGATVAPMLYLVDATGRVTDVRGLDGLDEKLAAIGL